jgi:hypothetical protein
MTNIATIVKESPNAIQDIRKQEGISYFLNRGYRVHKKDEHRVLLVKPDHSFILYDAIHKFIELEGRYK